MRPTRFSLSRRNASFAAFYQVCCRGLTTQAAPKAVPLSTSRAQPPTDSLARPSANDNVFSSPPSLAIKLVCSCSGRIFMSRYSLASPLPHLLKPTSRWHETT
ncbi:hypothetical protein DL93DRAFT_1300259 [Clavulina sp. PMI_390]|nr:hypothetical protein DL93DRAFT_1300259 [Clavulina sp. PMI_390]